MRVASFKVKLVVYFLLLALVPLGAAFWGFGTVVRRSETRRVDARLQAGLRSVVAAYQDEVLAAGQAATRLARDPALQQALLRRDRPLLGRLLRGEPHVRVVLGHEGPAPSRLTVQRTASVLAGGRVLGEIVESVPLDGRLVARARAHAGLGRDDLLVLLYRGRVAVGPPLLAGAALPLPRGRAAAVTAGGKRYRALVTGALPEPAGAAFAVLSPQAKIDSAAASTRRGLLLALVAALGLIGLVAYLLGRSIVGALGGLVSAANGIAQGRLGNRVPVRGRDEFAQLGRAFNEMAAQLEERVAEIEWERLRLRDAALRFGQALAATHDPERLRLTIVETAVAATRAAGGELVHGRERVVIGDPSTRAEALELPLVAADQNFGRLVLHGDSFGVEERELAALLASQAVVALDNARLHEIVERRAAIDALTGLANRGRCEELLRQELARARRQGTPVTFVFADLDGFKEINDRYGHPTGDLVLREFAATVRETVREIDHAARWGGEEFAILLPGTDLAGGANVAERIRGSLEDRTILTPEGERLIVTASFGVAACSETCKEEALLSAADGALYEAKRSGKNRVCTAGDGHAVHRPR